MEVSLVKHLLTETIFITMIHCVLISMGLLISLSSIKHSINLVHNSFQYFPALSNLIDHYNHSLSGDTTTMASKKCVNIG